ncbi:MAG TPA: pyridoxal phosphate-dependent aminotransferase [Candidatus Dormibacteraeota bacterium]
MGQPVAARPGISRRVGAIAESATLATDRRARELTASGQHVISFASGEPDFPTPADVVEAAIDACRDPKMHHYSPVAGLPELRQAVAETVNAGSGPRVSPANVLITSGTKQAVAHTFTTLLDPGDEVLITSPYWVTFPEAVSLAGGVPVIVPASESRGYRVSVEDLERHATERTKALLFVSPSNPTGAVYSEAQMREIGEWLVARGLWVVSDEIYQNLTYGTARFRSLPDVVPGLFHQAIRLSGTSKSYAMTGWRVGWMIAPEPVIAAASNLHSHVCGNIGNISQAAAVAALRSGLGSVDAMRAAFARRRDLMLAGLDSLPGVECPPPDGAFYVFPSVTGLLGREIRGERPATSAELADILLDQAKVAVVPGEAFGAPGHIRLSYALADDAIEEGLARIRAVLA